jgi:hypothetical protein
MNNTRVKRVAVYYRVPIETNISDAQVISEVNHIKDYCCQCNWQPEHIFIDKSVYASKFKDMLAYTADLQNNITAFFCFTAGNGFIELGHINNTPKPEVHADIADNKVSTGGIPFGYIIDHNGVFTSDTDKTQIITEIFRSRAEGASLQQIADGLNIKGIQPARGNEWSKQGVSFILKNRAYIGEYACDGKNKPKLKIPRLISTQIFNKVNNPN